MNRYWTVKIESFIKNQILRDFMYLLYAYYA